MSDKRADLSRPAFSVCGQFAKLGRRVIQYRDKEVQAAVVFKISLGLKEPPSVMKMPVCSMG